MLIATLALALAQAVTPPSPLPSNPPLAYPERARLNEIEGKVQIEVSVDEGGNPTTVRVLQVPKEGMGIEESVTDSVMRWKFSPAMGEGKPVAGVYRTSLDLALTIPAHIARWYPVTAARRCPPLRLF